MLNTPNIFNAQLLQYLGVKSKHASAIGGIVRTVGFLQKKARDISWKDNIDLFFRSILVFYLATRVYCVYFSIQVIDLVDERTKRST